MAVSLVAAALVVVMPSLPGLPDAPMAQAYNGGASNSSPAGQPCTEPCSFVGDNTGGGLTSFPYGGYQNYWSTWWSFTPQHTRVYTFRANSINPAGWDNTLTLTDTSGNVVAHNDDSYGLDAMISPSLTAGVTYRLGLGGYHSGSQGTANITISSSPPERPVTTGASATAGDRSASVSWTAPFDNYAAITQYRVYCNGGASACATVSGAPPATSTTVTGLTNGVSYTFEISAVNANGEGPRSSATNAVVPTGPTSTSVAASPGSPTYPNSYSVTATVNGTSTVNVGTVEFFRGGVSQGSVSVTNGSATLTGQSLAPGTYSYRADFSAAAAGARAVAPPPSPSARAPRRSRSPTRAVAPGPAPRSPSPRRPHQVCPWPSRRRRRRSARSRATRSRPSPAGSAHSWPARAVTRTGTPPPT